MPSLKRKIEQCEKEVGIQVEKIHELDDIMDELRYEGSLYPITDYYDIPMSGRPDNWEETPPSSPPDSFLSYGSEDEEGNDNRK